MKLFYLDKRDFVKAWLTPARYLALTVAGLVILFAPVWRETVEGRFFLEPARRAAVRVGVPGTLAETYADEGQTVSAGMPLLRLRNVDLESEAAGIAADLKTAGAHAIRAQLRYADYATAEHRRRELSEVDHAVQGKLAHLTVTSPITGIVVTPRVHDLLGSYLLPGTEVLEIADLSILQALIYVPEPDMAKIRVGTAAALRPDGLSASTFGEVAFLATSSSDLEKGLIPPEAYKGIKGSRYYIVRVPVVNGEGRLRDGMTGSAKIFVRRQSLAGFAWRGIRDFVWRKLW